MKNDQGNLFGGGCHCNKESCSDSASIPAEIKTQNPNEVVTVFNVINMDCGDEIRAIQEALKVEEVIKVQANLMTSTVEVLHKKGIERAYLKKKIESTVVKVVDKENARSHFSHNHRDICVFISGLFLLLGLLLEWKGVEDYISTLFFGVSICVGGILIVPNAFRSLKRITLDMNVLMAVAIIGAIGIREFSEAAAVVFLFSLSELLESLSVQKARKAIQSLLKITPKTVNLLGENGVVREIPVEEISLSQVVRVKAGDSIPLDGVVVSGLSSVNQAPLTGEFIPVLKTVGEEVFAGTINQEGTLDIKVSKLYNETKIAQVIRLVEDAQNQRAPSQKFIDSFARYYTPIIFLLAILTFLIPPLLFQAAWGVWFYKSLVLLVISCPCALVISTPISIVSSIAALARQGVLIKGGVVLENLGKLNALALDKTGTLTKGKPIVQKIVTFAPYVEKDILQVAASLEAHSNHPLATSIVEYAKERNVLPLEIENFTTISGRGIAATLDGQDYILGNHYFAHETGICSSDLEKTLNELEQQSLSVVVIGKKSCKNGSNDVLGIIALGDEIRQEASLSLSKMRESGISKIILLSGDNQKTATAVGLKVGTDEAFGDLLPDAKVDKINSLVNDYKFVAMVGDGVNDAPAMARASVGIAMGAMGSDTAIETSDIALMDDNLSQIAVAIKSGKRTLAIIKFNVCFAILTKILFIILTFVGYSNLWLAVVADTGATLLVILNSLRLLRLNSKKCCG